MNVGNGIGGPTGRINAAALVRFVLASKIGKVSIDDVPSHTPASEGKENLINELDRSCSAFDVEENPSHHATNVRPRQTGSKFLSTPLSVYHGVQPAASWNKRMHRICLSEQRSNQWSVPRGTRIKSPGSTSMPTTRDVFGFTSTSPRPS